MRSTLLPSNDLVFKVLLAEPGSEPTLIDLLTDVLAPPAPIARVTVLNPAVDRQNLADKAIVLDLLVRLSDGRRVNVEMQSALHPGFRARMLLYWSRVYAAQAVRGAEYTKLGPVVSIIFTNFLEEDSDLFHRVLRVTDQRGRVFDPNLEMHVVALPLRHQAVAVVEGDERLITWASFFGATSDEEVQEAVLSNPSLKPAVEALERLSADEQVKRLAEERERALLGWSVTLGAARQEGWVEGRVEGAREVLLRQLLRKFGPLTQADQARVHSATPEQLSRWADRLLDLETLPALFEA